MIKKHWYIFLLIVRFLKPVMIQETGVELFDLFAACTAAEVSEILQIRCKKTYI